MQPARARSTRARSARTLLALGAAAALAVVAVPGTAYAKSGARVSVNTQVVRIGQYVQVTASGGDDSAPYFYLCIDQRVGGGGWHALGCSSRPWTGYTRVVQAQSRGMEQFRARLLARNSPAAPLRLDRVSGAVNVFVAG